VTVGDELFVQFLQGGLEACGIHVGREGFAGGGCAETGLEFILAQGVEGVAQG
jgi:hypothetical protein